MRVTDQGREGTRPFAAQTTAKCLCQKGLVKTKRSPCPCQSVCHVCLLDLRSCFWGCLKLGIEGLDEEVPIKSAGDFNPVETSEGIRTLDLLKWSLRKWQIEIAPIWLIRAFGLNLHAKMPNKKTIHFSKHYTGSKSSTLNYFLGTLKYLLN